MQQSAQELSVEAASAIKIVLSDSPAVMMKSVNVITATRRIPRINAVRVSNNNFNWSTKLSSALKMILEDLGMTCFDESDCDLINNGHCVESQCSCKDNHIELNSFTCAPLLNAFCDDGIKCASTNSVCVNHKCQCEFTYVPKSNFECVLSKSSTSAEIVC